MGDYFDEDFRGAIRGLRSALEPLRHLRDLIDWQEPIRERIERHLTTIEAALGELGRIQSDAIDQLL